MNATYPYRTTDGITGSLEVVADPLGGEFLILDRDLEADAYEVHHHGHREYYRTDPGNPRHLLLGRVMPGDTMAILTLGLA